jgi:tetratricopeptide (TPR) repeat protein
LAETRQVIHPGYVKKDPQRHDPSDADHSAVAEATAALETARKSERVGSIAIAHARLAQTLATSGLHADAVGEYDELLAYLQLATSDSPQGDRRRAGKGAGSPTAPPSRAQAVDLNRLEVLARLNRVESLLVLGRHDDAQEGLLRAAPMCRGFRRKTFRKKLAQLQNRLDRTPPATIPEPASGQSPQEPDSTPTAEPEAGHLSAATLAERLNATDTTLASGDAQTAAREALGIIADCGDDDQCRAQARQILGMALEALGKPNESLATMRLSFADYLASGDSAQAANLAIPIALRMAANGERSDAIALVTRCLTEANESLSDSVRARLQTIQGRLLDQDDDNAGARRSFEAASQIAPDTQTMADAEHGLAVCLENDASGDAEQHVEALTLLDAAKASYSELGSASLVAGCEHEAAALLGRLKSFPAAANRYRKALVGFQKLNPQDGDAPWVAKEIADCQRNLEAIQSQETSDTTLFQSGGYSMSHEHS